MKKVVGIVVLTCFLFTLSTFFASCGKESPSAPSLQPLGLEDTVYITNTGSMFHRGNCQYVQNSKIAILKKDAIAQGYTACSVCKP
jgi:hypothetical protein